MTMKWNIKIDKENLTGGLTARHLLPLTNTTNQ
jgi:hypothetical protein